MNREFFNIIIDNREVFYNDRRCVNKIRCVPKDEQFIKTIVTSRNKYPHFLIDLFNLNESEKLEYDNAKSEEELSKIVIRDCMSIGARLINDA